MSNDPVFRQQKEALKKTSMAVQQHADDLAADERPPEPSALERLGAKVVEKLTAKKVRLATD
jgi:hypothetical protein